MSADFRTALKERVIVADGGMGTLLAARGLLAPRMPGTALNLSAPDSVEGVHNEYIAAGAGLIETNTFGASRLALQLCGLADKACELNAAGAAIARRAAAASGKAIWIAGSIGPHGPQAQDATSAERREAWREQARVLIGGGVDLLMLETFGDIDDLELAIEAVRAEDAGIPLVVQMAFGQTGATATGATPAKMIEALRDLAVDIIGHNCGGGEAAALAAARALTAGTALPVSIFANRGLADLDDKGRPVYIAGPEYFALQGVRIAETGAGLIGGCCGTTPADIAALAKAIGMRVPTQRAPVVVQTRLRPSVPAKEKEAACSGAYVRADCFAPGGISIIAEVDPPRGVDFAAQLSGARTLVSAGVHSITVADNPLSVMRMSNLAFTAILIRELSANVTLHIACRDRNVLGMQSHLLGAAALGVTNVLAITGDPIAAPEHRSGPGVFDVSSLNLIRMIRSMNDGEFSAKSGTSFKTDFCVGAAFNSGVKRLDAEASRAARKVESGANFLMTQPVYDLETADRILKLLEPLRVPVFIGVMPLVSERNAEFLHNEVPGIRIPDHVRERMRGKKGEEGRGEGLKLSMELIGGFAPRSRAVYLITPMGFYGMVAELAGFASRLSPRTSTA